MTKCFPKAKPLGGNVKVELDFPICAIYKKATRIDTSHSAEKY